MERKSVQFNAKIQFVEKINDEFLKCKVYVCALGKNRNLSHISREAADEAMYSLFNIPVVGHLYEDENGVLHMGGHDASIVQDKNGNYLWKSLTVPFGVVPLQDNIHYEDVKEANGDIKTYLVAECILWVGRYPELADAIYSEDWLFNQSMEINVNEYAPLEEDKNYTDILHYTYSALCLLGKSDDPTINVEPCFPDSHLEVAYELGGNEKFAALMEEMRKGLSKVFSAQDKGKEGEEGKMTTEIRDAILAEFGVTLDELDFEISEDMTEEVFREKVNEYACKKKKQCEENQQTNDDTGAAAQEAAASAQEQTGYAFTYREKAEALANAMPNSETVSYWVCDFDDKYVYVERCSYDRNTLDCTDERGRLEYTYDETAKSATVIGEFEPMIVRWLTKDEDAAITAMRGDYEALAAYKMQRENEDKQRSLDEVVQQFMDMAGNEEFDAIVANKYSYDSVESIRNACYIVRGKFGLIPKAHKTSDPSVPVGTPREPVTSRERLHAEYGKK